MQNKIRIGLVITPEGVELINSVLKDIKNIQATIIVYHREEDIADLIQKSDAQLDAIVFSGPVGYHSYIKQENRNDNIPRVCVGYTQMELSKGLLQLIGVKKDCSLTGISIDTFTPYMVNEVFEEIDVPLMNVFVKEFDPSEDHSEIISFHMDLWRSKKINHVITARRKIYLALKKEGIPVVRVFPTKFSIRESIYKAILLEENSKNLNSQIAVCIFSLLISQSMAASSDYELERLKLDFHRMLVDVAHKIDALIVPGDSFEFILYTNRGNVEEISRLLNVHFIEQLERTLSAKVCVGLGVGKTALTAQNHARQAMKHAKMQGDSCGFLVRDDGKIVGPIRTEEAPSYVYKSNEPFLNQIVQVTGLSIDTVSRIVIFSQKNEQFSAEELAHALNVTPRYVRNLINLLVDSSYLKPTGDERPYPRGRPRKLYTFPNACDMTLS
jgi:hypothetical protein